VDFAVFRPVQNTTHLSRRRAPPPALECPGECSATAQVVQSSTSTHTATRGTFGNVLFLDVKQTASARTVMFLFHETNTSKSASVVKHIGTELPFLALSLLQLCSLPAATQGRRAGYRWAANFQRPKNLRSSARSWRSSSSMKAAKESAVFTVVPVHRRTTEPRDAVEDGLYVGIGEQQWAFVRQGAWPRRSRPK